MSTGKRQRQRMGLAIRTVMLTILATLAALVGVLALGGAVALAEETCPNVASRRGPSLALPECRVYEQVTPVDKGDAVELVTPENGIDGNPTYELVPLRNDRGFAAEDGEAFMLKSQASIGSGAPPGNDIYVFKRGASGWSTTDVVPPVDHLQSTAPMVLDPVNLAQIGFYDQVGGIAELLTGNQNLYGENYLFGPVGGPYVTPFSLSGFSAIEEHRDVMVGGSADLSKVILESPDHALAPGAEAQDAGSEALYEATGGGECTVETSNCKLIVNEKGEPFQCGAGLGQGDAGYQGTYSAVSSDGSRVIFTAPAPNSPNLGPGCWGGPNNLLENPVQVYMRIDGERTVEVSAPEAGVEVGTPENPSQPAAFAGASADGSRVFFVTKTELTKDDTGNHAAELYEWRSEGTVGPTGRCAGANGCLTRASAGESGDAESNVDWVAAVSSDGSAVYFTAFGALAQGASSLEVTRIERDPVNLYRYDTLTGRTTYIAQVGAGGFPPSIEGTGGDWTGNVSSGKAEFIALKSDAEWYTTGDGQYLVFASEKPLTGFDNVVPPGIKCAAFIKSENGDPNCPELFRYNANAAEDHEASIVCVSCAGGAPIGAALFARAALESTDPSAGPPRPISENGEDVFFDTDSVLVSEATPGYMHVYEWHDGRISLISAPGDSGNAFFLGSSADGSNVFFSTSAQLARQDTDNAVDIYDARVDGGFEGLTPPVCTGTGCQGVPGAPPIFATPASMTFEGVGNFSSPEAAVKSSSGSSKAKAKPKKCKRGFVKKHGRCVREKAKKPAKGRK
jgi:hypothetical protein